jgi:hypothetical protein
VRRRGRLDILIYMHRVKPEISGFRLTPDTLWSPSHTLVDVAALYSATDASRNVSCALTAVSNEPTADRGDGNTDVDVIVVDVHNLQLRAERAGGGGRSYTATLTCSDPSGNVSTASAVARVVRWGDGGPGRPALRTQTGFARRRPEQR